jgi:radical SAM protein with 4Fe4S-binding SPASM domain
MTNAARLKRKNKYKTALGMQIILLPENYKEVLPLAKKAKGIGMDYLVVKPYSQHPLSITKRYQHIKYAGYLGLAEELKKLNCKDFNVIFRINTMVKWDEQGHSYKHCLALPFWAYIDASGRVWACSIYLGKERFCLGDIYTSSIGRIWGFAKRRRLIDWAASRLNTSQCRINCRMDEINRYLWELKHKPAHVNFI